MKTMSRIIFVAFILMCIFTAAAVFNAASGNEALSASAGEYTEVEVAYGDTLWSIADTYMPDDMDIRESVYIIKEANDISDSEIHEGDVLRVPEMI